VVINDNALTALAAAITALGTDDFPPALLEFLHCVADFDSSVIMAYPESGSLNVLYNALHEGDQSGFGGPYRDGLWLLSPTYLSAKAGLRGFFNIMDLAPDNFRDSEYFALYYRSSAVVDHTVFLLESGDGTPLAISLERTARMPTFSPQDTLRLKAVAGTIAALGRQHWKSALPPGEIDETGLHLKVQRVLQQFGTHFLTPRERDVVQLVLKGYPSKKIALELGISGQTEQVHRKNIYQKLGLSSHNQLFSLFFDALVQPCDSDSDPLTALLDRPAST
jgi:DNA-binding CsgD family transcriptional regulator